MAAQSISMSFGKTAKAPDPLLRFDHKMTKRYPHDSTKTPQYEPSCARTAKLVLPMISYKQGNLLESRAQALVNTVNTVGVMGKGIALMFKERFGCNNAK